MIGLLLALAFLVRAEIPSLSFTRASGLRDGDYRLRPGSDPACAEGQLRIQSRGGDLVDVVLGDRTLISHVGPANDWYDGEGCAHHTRTEVSLGHVDVTETNACGGGREVLILIEPGTVQYRAHGGERAITCALMRQ